MNIFTFPFRIVQLIFFSLLSIFQPSFLLGILGFTVGLLSGIVAGYFIFIYALPSTVEKPNYDNMVQKDGKIDPKIFKHIIPEMPLWVKHPDYDRVDWINSFIGDMWPFLNKAISKQVVEQVKPIINQYKPKKIDSIEFENFDLGDLPPSIAGIKVYDTTDDEMIIEPMLKWSGNQNIMIAVKAFGLKATAQLIDLLFIASVRIRLKPLVPVFPCFSRITVAMTQKPKIDFGLKIIGADLMAIPGLYNTVQKIAKDVISGMLLWPVAMEVYNDSSVSKPPMGWLYIRNIKCKGLKNFEAFSASDPYIKFSLGEKIGNKQTSVKKNNLNPVWDEEYQLVVRDTESQVLSIQVFDEESSGDDILMGVQSISLKELVEGEAKQFSLELLKNQVQLQQAQQPKSLASASFKSRGTLTLDLLFEKLKEEELVDFQEPQEETKEVAFPSHVPVGGGMLIVTVHSAEGLEVKGHSNPSAYVKIRFRSEEKKTKVIKKQSNPDFEDEPFEFYANEPPSDEILHVQVFSKTSGLIHLGSKDCIGSTEIPLRDVIMNKRINELYQLNESKNGKIKIELEWFNREANSKIRSESPVDSPRKGK